MVSATRFVSGKRPFLRFHALLFPLILAGLLLPAAAVAQVSYTGTAATQNFGSQPIGSPSAARTLSFSVAAGTTVGSIAVVTQGAPNLDFNSASGGTCTAKEYASATTCTVDVTFKPRGAGLRTGAVVFYSEANNKGTALGSVPVYGIGTGPQIAYNPAPATAIDPTVNGETLNSPAHVALDGAGDLFIADAGNNRVVEVPVGGGAATAISPTVNGEGLNQPDGMAVDGAGNLFISDFLNDRVVEVPAGGGAATAFDPEANGQGLSGPSDLALDGAGDLFIADFNNNRVVEVPAGGGAPTAIDPTVNGEGLSGAPGVAVDGAGNLFISDYNHNRVLEVPAAGGAPTAIAPTVNGEVLNQPNGVAVDGAGDVFMTDQNNNRVVEVPAGGGTPTAFDPIVNGEALNHPYAVALDGAGDLFIDDSINNREVELQRSLPPSVNFPTDTDVGSTDTTDGTQTVQIQSIGNEALTLTALSYPPDFSEASGDTSACTGSTSLGAGQQCDLLVEFTPLHGGALSEDAMLTDNALNAASPEYAQQSIPLKGTSIPLNSIVITPSSSFATLPGGSQQFTATGSYSGGSTQNLTSLVLWNSSKTTAVTIGASGLATAQSAGAATITASLDGVTSNAVTLTVDSAAQASIAGSSGSGQSTYVTAAFANPLVAVVKNASGNALQGVPVTFTAPSSGAGASFSNGAEAITVASDGNGLATVPVVANGTAGSYSVTATVGSLSASFSLTNLAWPVYSVTTLVDDAVGLGTNCTDPTLKVSSCSLRDAVTAANALPQTTLTPVTAAMMPTINFASSLNLSAKSPGNYNVTNGGTLTIGANMNIVGPGANLLTLNGAGNQIFNISSGTVFLSGLSLVNGGTPTSEDQYGNGGSGSGGGIYNNGTLTVTNSTFSGNSATGGNGDGSGPPEIGTSGGNGSGGGIYNSGTLTVTNSTFSGNSANGGGGYGDAPGGGGSGGGIYNGGTLTVTNSTFNGNSTTGGVGGGGSDGDGDVGFPGSDGDGGGIYNGGTLTVTNSTFSGNSATGGSGGQGCCNSGNGGNGNGGGISNGGTLTVTNSTFSGNGATGGFSGGSGGGGYGGGISNGGTLTARNSIFSGNNSANGGGGFVSGVAYGAGIYNNLHANADSNVYYNNLTNGSEDDCNGCTTNTKAVSGDPKLTVLGNYGGATQTMLPQPGSAAICAGAVGDIPVGVTTDQRGFARTNSTYEDGTVCVDAGAVQTNYAMAFTTEPPAIVLRGQAISPAPAVALTESGAAATAVTRSVAMTDSDKLLSGTTTASFLSGTATFSNLLITSVTSSDKLIATLALNPTINLTAQSTAFQAQTAALTSPTPGSVLDSPSVTFTWTAATGVTAYGFSLGFKGAGSSDLYTLGSTAATSATVTGLQTKGATIYARLFYEVAGVWLHLDYTYTEGTSTAATMISPGQGGTLGASGVMFKWMAGALVTNYQLWLGVAGPGSSDLYVSPLSPATSVTVPSLPADGAKVYARLFSEGSGGIQYVDYTYTEATGTSAVMNLPRPGNTLGISNVTFTWFGGTDVTKYDLLVGLGGPGSGGLFDSGPTTALTATVPKLPANGATIYVRLMSDISGTWHSTDYTYMAQ